MRKVVKETKLVEKEVVIENTTLCDKCGKDVLEGREFYDAYECDIEIKTGRNYPATGYGKQFNLDLCKACYKDFIQLLKKNGYGIQEREWE